MILKLRFYPSTVADPGFPRGGGANPKRGEAPTYYLVIFSRKLHENEEILVRGGVRASLRPPLDPPLKYKKYLFQRKWKGAVSILVS